MRDLHFPVLAAALFGCLAGGCRYPEELHEAAACADDARIHQLLADGADPNARNEQGDTALHVAAMGDRGIKVVRVLVDAGGDVNARNNQGWTPLHRVVAAEIAELLIARGADVNARDNTRCTPLHIAVGSGHGRVSAEDILMSGRGSRDIKQRIVSVYAARHQSLVKLLIDKGADLNAREIVSSTPLHMAAREGHLDDVQVLVECGADPYAEDNYGRTPLNLAQLLGHEVIGTFLSNHMDGRAPREKGRPDDDASEDATVLLEQLGSANPENRRSAASALGSRALEAVTPEVRAAVAALAGLLDDPHLAVRREAALALARIGPGAALAVPALTRALETGENPRARCDAAAALGQIGPAAKDAVPALSRAVKSQFLPLRKTAVYALGQVGPGAGGALPALLSALQDESAYVRMRAAQSLGRIGLANKTVVSALRRSLQDDDRFVRVWSASALQKLQPTGSDGVSCLIRSLGSDESRVREAAARAIGEVGPGAKKAVPALIRAFSTLGRDGRMDLLGEALGKVGPAGIDALIVALNGGDAETRCRAASALRCIGPPAKAAIPALVDATNDEDPAVRAVAGDALTHIREPRPDDVND